MADLLAIRTRLVNEAGRADLVVDLENDDYTDKGANQAINDGIEWLNSLRADLENILSTESFANLLLDTDTNYWSDDFPHLLVNAARRMLEVRQRNTSGVKDWDTVIMGDFHRIYANAVKVSIDNDIAADKQQRVMGG